MKLRNKKTGEIGDIAQTSNNAIIVYYPIVDGVAINPQHRAIYESLAELNEEWEDYEEPKEYWFINDLDGKPMKCELRYCPVRDIEFTEWSKKRKQIGNHFETREEAELAVEKLKAWKRLKDKGFRFERWFGRWLVGGEYNDETRADLDVLFGGEE